MLLKSKKPLTVDQIADKTKLDRTTVFRALQKLSREGREGLCHKENQPLPGQGYVQVYHSVSKEEFNLEIEKRIRFVQEGLERLLKKLEDDINELLVT
jgi:predicted transcriptional regulator